MFTQAVSVRGFTLVVLLFCFINSAQSSSDINSKPTSLKDQTATPTCPQGARLLKHKGVPKCAWESALKQVPEIVVTGTSYLRPDLWFCFVIGRVSVFDYFQGFRIVFCINLTDLFEPCSACADGKQCRFSNGQSKCVYDCSADQVGGGQQPCQTCGSGEVPNDNGATCETCEHGESSTAGTCNPDPCDGLNCPQNTQCINGHCHCSAGYRPTVRTVGTPGEPEKVMECVRDRCHGVVCGKNSGCLNGTCQCKSGYEDSDGDGSCTKACTQAAYDARAKSSLLSIPREPWEQGEAYSCINGSVTVLSPRTNASNYLYTDFPTNAKKNEKAGDVCTLYLGLGSGGGGHSHPHFVWPRDEDVQCGPDADDTIDSRMTVRKTNANNAHFQPNDRSAARGSGLPLYLVVPNRNCVKVYRQGTSSRWGQSGCL